MNRIMMLFVVWYHLKECYLYLSSVLDYTSMTALAVVLRVSSIIVIVILDRFRFELRGDAPDSPRLSVSETQ